MKEARTFAATTASLIELSEWLTANCTHVAMEATGVYWALVWHILSDESFELVLANAAHIKNVPGRKTDVKDADWVSLGGAGRSALACAFIVARADASPRNQMATDGKAAHVDPDLG